MAEKSLWGRLKSAAPIRIIVGSFLLLILIGTGLLLLPVSSAEGPTSPLSALFTATSATCVTGLSVVDTTAHWSTFGQAVILTLIQLGGLGLSTFAIGFTLLFRRKLGIRERMLASESSGGSALDAAALLKLMLGFTFCCEALGAGFLMLRMVPLYGRAGIWPSVFVAVSAYCNAGFDIWGFVPGNTASLVAFAGDPLVSVTLSLLVAIGGLGFVVVLDIYRCRVARRFRRKEPERLRFFSQICLRVTLVLLAVGTAGFFLLEYGNTLKDLNFFGKLNAALFQSSNTRTAGFASVDIAAERDLTKVFTCILMFIGGCPGSTAGGIKVTTLVVLAVTVRSTLRGTEPTVLGHRFTAQMVNKALTVMIIGLLVVCIDAGFLSVMNPQVPFMDCLLEAASAFGTVGLSASVTPSLEPFSKLLLCLTMFIGRVGPVSFGLSIMMRRKGEGELILPEGRMLIG